MSFKTFLAEQDLNKAAVTVIINDNKVLILKRSSKQEWMPNWWNLPGGHIKAEEKPIQAAARELKEESGITSNHLVFLKHIPGTMEIWVYYGHIANTNVDINVESTAYKWVTPNELDNFNVVPNTKRLVHLAMMKDNGL